MSVVASHLLGLAQDLMITANGISKFAEYVRKLMEVTESLSDARDFNREGPHVGETH